MNRLPRGAYPIAQARDNGKRPADPVVVSLCGWRSEFSNPQVLATRPDHDWTFMLGLEAIVCVDSDSRYVRETLNALRITERIDLWDVKRTKGMTLWPVWKGENVPEVHWTRPENRRDAVFARWARVHWTASENERFACA